MNREWKPVDLHCHFNHGAEHDTVTSEIYNADLGFLQHEHERLGIRAVCMSTFDSVLSCKNVYAENDYLAELAAKEDGLYQWAVLDPRQPELFPQVEKLLQLPKTVGIKIHSPCHEYPILEYADAIFSFANEHKAFVCMHPDEIPSMAQIMDRYPDAKLIIAHLGSVEHVDAVADAKHHNIYVDTSGMASFRNNVVEYAVSRVGSEHIFFGTDTYSCAFQLGRILLSELPDADKENILFRNAEREFTQFR